MFPFACFHPFLFLAEVSYRDSQPLRSATMPTTYYLVLSRTPLFHMCMCTSYLHFMNFMVHFSTLHFSSYYYLQIHHAHVQCCTFRFHSLCSVFSPWPKIPTTFSHQTAHLPICAKKGNKRDFGYGEQPSSFASLSALLHFFFHFEHANPSHTNHRSLPIHRIGRSRLPPRSAVVDLANVAIDPIALPLLVAYVFRSSPQSL